jgi:peptidoglycan-associated lipoprotein
MFNKVALAFCMLLALSGCSSSGKGMNSSSSATADFEKNVGDRVYFGFDKHDLSAEAKAQLDRQAAWLTSKERASISVAVEGHCDERGTREYNLALGEKRANSAKNYLVSKGVAANRIETISYGKERPAAIGNTEEVFKINRRSVTVIK